MAENYSGASNRRPALLPSSYLKWEFFFANEGSRNLELPICGAGWLRAEDWDRPEITAGLSAAESLASQPNCERQNLGQLEGSALPARSWGAARPAKTVWDNPL
jgi:hypothetical protein